MTFSRAVIALGADFAPGMLPQALTPFTFTPAVAGKLRWVTTSIARFDPDDEWPLEQELTLAVNPTLRSFDGAALAPPDATRSYRFHTPQLTMHAGHVHSAAALAHTNGSWSAALHPIVPGALEYPPDATIELLFSASVDRSLLQSALTVQRHGSNGHAHVSSSPSASAAVVLVAPCAIPRARCVRATVRSPLDVNTAYDLVLPAGSSFDERAGRTRASLQITISGLVPFALPFLKPHSRSFQQRYRRMRLWLRHGLAPGLGASDLLANMRLATSDGRGDMPIRLVRARAATMLLEAPSLEPGRQYTLRVRSADSVRDGFGLPLLAGRFDFETAAVASFFLLPGSRSAGASPPSVRVSTHNASAARLALQSWPALLRGDDLCAGCPECKGAGVVPKCWDTWNGRQPQVSELREVSYPSGIGALIAAARSSRETPGWLRFVSQHEGGALLSSVSSKDVAPRVVTSRAAPLHEHLLAPPGILMHTTRGLGGTVSRRTSIVSAGHMAAIAVAVPDEALLVWVLNATSGAPLEAAEVRLLSASCYSDCAPDAVTVVAPASSSDRGVARFERHLLPSRGSLYAAVASPKSSSSSSSSSSRSEQREVLLLDSVPRPLPSAPPPAVATLLTDRAVFKPNDTCRVKGYLRIQDEGSGKLRVPSASQLAAATLQLRVRWARTGPEEETSLAIDSTHGSFDASLHVPAGASYGEHTITLAGERGRESELFSSYRILASRTVAVADPRPPTVELSVLLPRARVLPPNGTIPVQMATRTLSGVPLRHQQVRLRWRRERRGAAVPRPCELLGRCAADVDGGDGRSATEEEEEDDDDEANFAGEEAHVTGDDGTLTLQWRPHRAEKTSAGGSSKQAVEGLRLGDELHLDLEYVGPTRERLISSKTIPVAISENTLALSASRSAELPLHAFDLDVDLATHSALGGASVAGVPIRIGLHALPDGGSQQAMHADDDDNSRELSHGSTVLRDGPASALPITASGSASLVDGCIVTSGKGATTRGRCHLALPAVGRFLAVACAPLSSDAPSSSHTANTPELCTAILLGRTEAEWQASPLAEYLPVILAPTAQRALYALGDAPVLVLRNPLAAPLRAMLCWGTTIGHQHLISDALPPGENRIVMPPLGVECALGCDVSLTIIAAADAARRSPVVASPLFDITAPMLGRFTVNLAVAAPPEPLHVALDVASAVVAPGATTSVSIRLSDEQGRPVSGEVALFAVDKAMLNVRPLPLTSLSSALKPTLRRDSYSTTDSYRQLISPAAIGTSAARLLALLEADPWLPAEWPLSPGHHLAEGSLADGLATHVTDITDMPYAEMAYYAAASSRRSRMRGGGPEQMMMMDDAMEDEAEMAMPTMAMEASPMLASARMDAPQAGGGMGMAAARAAPKMMMRAAGNSHADGAVGGGGAAAGPKVRVRSTFETTPLFMPSVAVDASGHRTIQWTLPDNTGAYELRAYAVRTADGTLGGGTAATQLVRKRVTLAASVPRVARVGDTFRCGVTATGSPELPAGSALVATLSLQQASATVAAGVPPPPSVGATAITTPAAQPPLALVGSAEQRFVLAPSDAVELTFEMRAEAIGEAVLVATVHEVQSVREETAPVASGGGGGDPTTTSAAAAADAMELRVPVLGVQPEVTVATSMALRVSSTNWADGGRAKRIWPEAVQLPAALPNSGTLTIGAAAGRLAAVSALASGLRALPPKGRSQQPWALDLLGRVAISAMLAPYEHASSDGASDSGAAAGREYAEALATLPQLASLLRTMSSKRNGLCFSAQALSHAFWDAGSVDLHLNALGVLLIRRLRLASVPLPAELTRLGREWASALSTGLVSVAEGSIRRFGSWSDLQTLAVCRLALGGAWEASSVRASVSAAVGSALSMEVLERGVDSLSMYAKAAYALTLLLPTDPSDDGDWLVRTRARTGRARRLEVDTRAAGVLRYVASCLRVTARSAYIARDASSWDAAGQRETALALSALAIGAANGASAEAGANLDKLANHVASGGFNGMEGVGGGAFVEGLALADYDAASGNLAAEIDLRAMTGAATLYAARLKTSEATAAIKTLPWSMLPPPPSAPLLFATSGEGEASVALSLNFIPAKIFSAPVYRGFAVAKIIRRYDALTDAPDGPPLAAVPVGWSRETRKDAVAFQTAWAHAGTHTLSYEALAVTRGTFHLPPTKASMPLQPEVMGLSAGGTLVVSNANTPPRPLDTANADASAGSSGAGRTSDAGKRCPRDCSGRGTCDPETGRCACSPDAAGDDCTGVRLPPVIGAINRNDTVGPVMVGSSSSAPHVVAIPFHCPSSTTPASRQPPSSSASGSGGGDTTLLKPPSPSPPAPPASAVKATHFYVLSSHEDVLPITSLSLTAVSVERLELRIAARTLRTRITRSTCVRVTVGASADGIVYGGRVLAVWLQAADGRSNHPGEVATIPIECVGDGEGYQPMPWEGGGGSSGGGGGAQEPWRSVASPDEQHVALVAQYATLGVAAFALLAIGARLVARAVQRWRRGGGGTSVLLDRHTQRSEYPDVGYPEHPEPADSPGSQADGYPPDPAAVEPPAMQALELEETYEAGGEEEYLKSAELRRRASPRRV